MTEGTEEPTPGDAHAEAVRRERAQFVDIVGTEISAIWRNVTRLGGQCVAALYLSGAPRSMDDLSSELGRSKSNVFANLRALESLGIVRRVRVSGSQRDHFELAARYPDVLVVAFARHLSHALRDKSTDLFAIAGRLEALGRTPEGGETEAALSERADRIGRTYAAVGQLIDGLLPKAGEAADLSSILGRIDPGLLQQVIGAVDDDEAR